MVKMDEKEVNMLYRLVPDLDDPHCKNKTVLHTVNQTSYIMFKINDSAYICESNPYKDDIWYYLS